MDIEDIDRDMYERGQAEDRRFNWQRMEALEKHADELASKGREYKRRAETAEAQLWIAKSRVKGLRAALQVATKTIKHPARFARVVTR